VFVSTRDELTSEALRCTPGCLVRILGPVQIVSATDEAVAPASATQRKLVAMLALRRGETVRRELLEDQLAMTAGALRKAVSRLRQQFGNDIVESEPTGYRFNLELDADRFLRGVANAGLDDDRIASLDAALAMWRGDVLDEFSSEPWARAEVARLTEFRSNAIEDRIEALLERGRFPEAIGSAQQQIERHPLRDRPRGLLIRSLAGAGRQTEALRAYQSYRAYLAEEVGTEPSATIVEIEKRVVQGWDGSESRPDLTRLGRDVAGPRPPVPSMLAPTTEWIGSSLQWNLLAEDLPNRRVVTVIGPGGIGKTRTAFEIIRRAEPKFADGVRAISLAPIAQSDDLPAAVASAMGIQTQPRLSFTESIVDWLRGRSILVVFDNCEHVLDSAAELVDAITAGTDTVTVLATSRERLQVSGERVVRVDVMEPDDGVALFVQRAQSIDETVRLSDDDQDAIRKICAQLDHVPLAIELAAGRITSMSPPDLLARLNDRFALLRGGPRGGNSHHRALEDTVDWSYRLLEEREQRVFDALSVFAGSFDLAAAEAIGRLDAFGSAVAAIIGSLVDKSMVVVERGSFGVRYRLLETLRQFGRSRLIEGGHDAEIYAVHAHHFVDVTKRANELWFGGHQLDADAIFDREWDNIRAAHSFAISAYNLAAAEQIIEFTSAHASNRMRSEHREWGEATLTLTPAEERSNEVTVMFTAWWAMISGDGQRSLDVCDRILADPKATATARAMSGGVRLTTLWSLGRSAEAEPLVREIEETLPTLDMWQEWNVRRALFTLASRENTLLYANRLAIIAESIGAPALIASARFYQGVASSRARTEPSMASAIDFHSDGIVTARSARADFPESQNLQGLLDAMVSTDAPDAPRLCAEALRRLHDLRYWLYLWRVVDGAAWLLASRGNLNGAATTLGHLDAHVAPWTAQPRSATRAILAKQEQMVPIATLSAQGAEMQRDAVVRFVIDEISRL
jgi:predicted ATPase/DNA-binding SARP family transcriptional activator